MMLYITNTKALGIVVLYKKIFKSFHFKNLF